MDIVSFGLVGPMLWKRGIGDAKAGQVSCGLLKLLKSKAIHWGRVTSEGDNISTSTSKDYLFPFAKVNFSEIYS
jgi:hypothetical protein